MSIQLLDSLSRSRFLAHVPGILRTDCRYTKGAFLRVHFEPNPSSPLQDLMQIFQMSPSRCGLDHDIINVSATGIRYSSFGVALLRSLKSTQTRHRPSIFCTGTTLEIHSAYRHGLMNPASNIFCTSFLTSSRISAFIQNPFLSGSRCSMMLLSKPGISV